MEDRINYTLRNHNCGVTRVNCKHTIKFITLLKAAAFPLYSTLTTLAICFSIWSLFSLYFLLVTICFDLHLMTFFCMSAFIILDIIYEMFKIPKFEFICGTFRSLSLVFINLTTLCIVSECESYKPITHQDQ